LNLPENLVKAVFELRLACLAGYQPDLFGCHVCGSQEPELFDISEGVLECGKCRSLGGGIRMPVNAGLLDAMRYICLCEPKKLFAFQLSNENLDKLASLTEAYLCAQLERGFSTLDFYKSLLI
jgi:DNA repair protein RecO (recombination protein O)